MPSVYVNVSSSGDNALVSAPGAGKFIRVLGYSLTAAGDAIAILGSDTRDVAAVRLKDGGGAVIAPSDAWELDLDVNTALELNLSAAVQCVGHVTYKIVGN